jgi:hypothetical protein
MKASLSCLLALIFVSSTHAAVSLSAPLLSRSAIDAPLPESALLAAPGLTPAAMLPLAMMPPITLAPALAPAPTPALAPTLTPEPALIPTPTLPAPLVRSEIAGQSGKSSPAREAEAARFDSAHVFDNRGVSSGRIEPVNAQTPAKVKPYIPSWAKAHPGPFTAFEINAILTEGPQEKDGGMTLVLEGINYVQVTFTVPSAEARRQGAKIEATFRSADQKEVVGPFDAEELNRLYPGELAKFGEGLKIPEGITPLQRAAILALFEGLKPSL